jgi:hypothetical protein
MEQQKNIADIQRKIAALSGDNSASAIAKRKQLEAELAEANADLEESYYDRSVENKQEALDKELEDFQNEKDAEIEKWDEYLTNVETVVADSLGIIQTNATGVYDTLTSKAQEYNLTLSDSIMTPWRDGALAVSDYQATFDTAMSSTTSQLEALKNKWQEVIDKMSEAAGKEIQEQKKENDKIIAAKKEQPKQTTVKKEQPKKTTTSKKTKAPSVGGTVKVKTSATHFSSKSGNVKMASFVPGGSYTVYQVSGDQILIGKNGVYTGWVKKSDLQGYAKGTTSLKQSGLINVDELGEELILRAHNGRLTYAEKGTGIIPADLTERLMNLAMNPQEMLDRNRPQITPHNSVVNNNMEFKIDASVGELIHVERLEGGDLKEINKVIDRAWDKKMQGLNNAIKKFSR